MSKHSQKGAERQEKRNKPRSALDATAKQVQDQSTIRELSKGLTQAANDSSIQDQAAHLSDARFPTAQRQAMARQISRVGGNRYLQKIMPQMKQDAQAISGYTTTPAAGNFVQRQAPDTAATSTLTQYEALKEVFWTWNALDDLLKEFGDTPPEDLRLSVEEAHARFDSLKNKSQADPLTELQVIQHDEFIKDAERVYERNLATVRSAVRRGLAPLANTSPDTSALESELAEEMHFAFIEGSEDRVGQIKDAVDKIKAYNEKVKNVAEWASKVARAAGAAKTLGTLENVVGGTAAVGNVLGKISDVLTAAKSLTTIAGLDNQAVGAAQNSIGQFEQAMAAIDLTMTFSKGVPLLGQLWSSYYAPMINTCIKLLRKIARYRDFQVRQEALFEWMQRRKDPPIIPKGLHNYFPGGQPVLTFMYQLVNTGEATPTPAVEKFFLEHRDLFNVGQEWWDKLETKSTSSWYNPWTWGDKRLTNLMSWVHRNRNTVWSMLYGDMPHNLRSG